MRMSLLIAMTAVIVINIGAIAQGSNVDWKYYGGTPIAKEGFVSCFYDAKGVTKKSDGYLRVWIKCLSVKDIKAINIKKDFNGKIIKSVVKRVAHYYIPPIARVEDITFDEMLNIVGIEEIADIAYIQPKVSMYYELNCTDRKLRELSITIGSFSSDKTTSWQYVPPEGNAANLLKILCPIN